MSSFVPFFIVGHPRSGTTALAKLVDTLPGVSCVFWEGNILNRLWYSLQRVDLMDEPVEDLLIDFEVTARYNLLEKISQGSRGHNYFTEKSISFLVESLREGLQQYTEPEEIYNKVSFSFFDIFSTATDSKSVGDKVPEFMFISDKIVKPHPDSKLILITRDPRATINSSLEFNQGCLHLFAVQNAFAMAVSFCIKQLGMEKHISRFPKERLLIVEQESLLANPQKIAAELHHFFEISSDSLLHQASKTVRTKQWKKELSQENQNAINSVCNAFEVVGKETVAHKEWDKKAFAIKKIFNSSDESIVEVARAATTLFQSRKDRIDFSYSILQIADYYHRRSEFTLSKVLFEEASNDLWQNPILLYKHALLCYDMKLLKEALTLLEHFNKYCPKTDYYLFLRSKVFYLSALIMKLSGDVEKAKLLFQQSLQLKPEFLLARNMIKWLA
jgi:tetratricopeptide (TPR) repeat protein